jgi:hypothetical protein
MAIVVLVLWLLTAGAGFYLLVTSSLGRPRTTEPGAVPAPKPTPAPKPASAPTAQPASAPKPASAPAAQPASAPAAQPASAPAAQPASAPAALSQSSQPAAASPRAARDRFAPPSLIASRQAPMLPGARSLLEFAHPACALVGLACWLGFTLIHDRALGWIAFALIAATACLGLAWFTANVRAARGGDGDGLAPSFAGRLVVLHGCAAAVTITLAALTALVTRG